VLIRPGRFPDRHPPLRSGQSLNPPRHPTCEPLVHGPSTGVSSRSPVRSSLCPRNREGTSGASASPRAPHPAVTGSARQGQGQLPLNPHPSISNPLVRSMRATSRRTARGRCAAARGPRLASTSARVSRAWCRVGSWPRRAAPSLAQPPTAWLLGIPKDRRRHRRTAPLRCARPKGCSRGNPVPRYPKRNRARPAFREVS
jgi:hypothetical protein